LLAEQRAYLDEFWDGADVRVEGDPPLQQAVRFALFHVLQTGARGERRCLPAKGLTGPGYDGHTFWDTEAYVLPVLTYTQPQAAADALRWRHATLDLARQRAATLGLRGAAFPWRTIHGEECSGYWPAGTAAFHVNADIAAAVTRYRSVTGDETLEAEVGLELLVETARLWMSLGHHDVDGAWHVDGVTGPDEYTAIVNDNLFTNLAAAHNLHSAAEAADATPTWPATWASPSRSWRPGGTRPTRSPSPTTPACASTSRARGSPDCRNGTSRRPATSTRCCCTRRTSTCTATRSSSRPICCWPSTGSGTASTTRTGAQRRLLRAAHRP
jgi:trehalose/maltose hydrolase-like predicted phosphorylase